MDKVNKLLDLAIRVLTLVLEQMEGKNQPELPLAAAEPTVAAPAPVVEKKTRAKKGKDEPVVAGPGIEALLNTVQAEVAPPAAPVAQPVAASVAAQPAPAVAPVAQPAPVAKDINTGMRLLQDAAIKLSGALVAKMPGGNTQENLASVRLEVNSILTKYMTEKQVPGMNALTAEQIAEVTQIYLAEIETATAPGLV